MYYIVVNKIRLLTLLCKRIVIFNRVFKQKAALLCTAPKSCIKDPCLGTGRLACVTEEHVFMLTSFPLLVVSLFAVSCQTCY